MQHDDDVLVVGAGVIGLATALALSELGRKVRVLEAGVVGGGSSHGNCGTITPSHAAPLAEPGRIGRTLAAMLTPDAPFYLKPRADPALAKWMWRFARRCNAHDWHAGMAPKAALLNLSRQLLPALVARHGLQCEYVESGVDYVFRDAARLREFAAELPALARHGVAGQRIDGLEYQRQEPALRDGVAGAIRFAGDAHLRPDRYVSELARVLRARGVDIVERNPVEAIERNGCDLAVRGQGTEHHARDVVVATGAWSPRLARVLGFELPIQPGKGYSITYERPGRVPRRPLVLVERSVCVTTWDSGYRLGSTMEFSGYDTTLNRRRLAALERGATEYLVEPVGPAKVEEWYGWRPMTWDDLPVLDRAPGHEHLWLATGHGMLGVSMSAATAQIVARMIVGAKPPLDPAPFRLGRLA